MPLRKVCLSEYGGGGGVGEWGARFSILLKIKHPPHHPTPERLKALQDAGVQQPFFVKCDPFYF